MRALGALAVCICLVTAGCIGTVGATAKDHEDTASEHAAQQLGGSADLVDVSAFESSDFSGFDDVPGKIVNLTDDDIGDGAPPFWVYTYQNETHEFELVVAENGTVIANETDDDPEEDAVPIGDWDVDSSEAADNVADENNSWEVSEDGTAFYNLERENETSDPIWNLALFREPDTFVVARVNANTGEVLRVESPNFDFGGDFDFGPSFGGDGDDGEAEDEPPEREGGSFSDTVTATSSTVEHSFEIDEPDHPALAARLALEGPTTGNTVEATIEGPDGTVGTLEAGDGSTETMDAWDDPAPGDYTVTVELTQGTSQDYTFQWCATGEESGDEETDQACEEATSAPGTMAPVAGPSHSQTPR